MHILATTSDCKHCKKFIIVRTMEAQIQVSLLLLPDWIQSNLCSFLLKVAKKLSENLCLWPSPVQITQNCCVCVCASAFFVRCCCCKCHQDFDKCFCYCGLFVEPTDGIAGPFIKKINVSLSRICPIVTRATTRFSLKIVKKQTYFLLFINKNKENISIWPEF